MVSKPSVPQVRRETICFVGYGNSKTENTQSTVIHEKTDMSGQVRHCVEGVGCSAGQGKDDTHKHVCEQWPAVTVMLEVQRIREVTQDPKEIPGGQEMSPKVQGFIGGIEHTEDALKRGALRVAVAADDEVLMEMLWNLMDLIGGTGKSDRSHPGQLLSVHWFISKVWHYKHSLNKVHRKVQLIILHAKFSVLLCNEYV